uniref:Uncharacterized protein n=1 Tax=Meloidogyne hapla TaxID=6305 RepID=A0A1I8AZH5_MELHA
MLVRCLLPMELDTGPWTRKSSTLCSLLLLLTIAAFAVPGQVNSEEVGLGKHTKTGDKVELSSKMDKANETNFNSDDYKKRFPNACDVKINSKTIELQYDYNSTGCIVDLLSINKNNNKSIKFTAGVRNKRGGIKKCLDDGFNVHNSVNNTLLECRSSTAKTTVSSKSSTKVLSMVPRHCVLMQAHVKQEAANACCGLGEVEPGKKQFNNLINNEMTFEMEIEDGGVFTMDFRVKESFNAAKEVACVQKNNSIVEPETWTITNTDLKDERLLVFSLLPLSASFVFDGNKLIKPPVGPHCDLFVQFNRPDYELLFVPPPPPSTPAPTTTTKTSSTRAETSPKTATCVPCLCALASTTPMTTAATNISSTGRTVVAVMYPTCPEESSGGLYILGFGLTAMSLCICVIAILVWLCMKDKAGKEKKAAEKQEAERGGDERLQALYKAEAKIKGPKKIGTFSAWKKDRKENETKTAMGLPSIEDQIVAIWKSVEKEKANDKMQYLGEQFIKQRDKELLEREYQPELKMKGLRAVGSFEDWKKKKNIATTFTLTDGTRTAIEYEEPKVVEKVIIETVKADEFTLEEKDHLPLSGEEEGVSVPKSEEEEEDIRDIPQPVDDTPKVTLDI